jgi:hypothetical protein
MRRLLFAVLSATLTAGVGFATTASAAPQAATPHSTSAQFTCMYFQNPTVEAVWSKVCHF